jgi:hypothetical protein
MIVDVDNDGVVVLWDGIKSKAFHIVILEFLFRGTSFKKGTVCQ